MCHRKQMDSVSLGVKECFHLRNKASAWARNAAHCLRLGDVHRGWFLINKIKTLTSSKIFIFPLAWSAAHPSTLKLSSCVFQPNWMKKRLLESFSVFNYRHQLFCVDLGLTLTVPFRRSIIGVLKWCTDLRPRMEYRKYFLYYCAKV